VSEWSFEPLEFDVRPVQEVEQRAQDFYETIRRRRTVRAFSDRAVPRDVIENALRAAGSAPSGANMQPWHFVAIANPGIKARIRIAAEIEEKALYEHRAGKEWLKALAPLGTDEHKPFLEVAPWLIAVFLKRFTVDADGERRKNYYTAESVGIACGFLLAALHWSGLATLTHTPSPMKFLGEVLERPDHERAYMLIVAGYPAEDAMVPAIKRQPLEAIASFVT
jgi:iodotyrosine deiodinase